MVPGGAPVSPTPMEFMIMTSIGNMTLARDTHCFLFWIPPPGGQRVERRSLEESDRFD